MFIELAVSFSPAVGFQLFVCVFDLLRLENTSFFFARVYFLDGEEKGFTRVNLMLRDARDGQNIMKTRSIPKSKPDKKNTLKAPNGKTHRKSEVQQSPPPISERRACESLRVDLRSRWREECEATLVIGRSRSARGAGEWYAFAAIFRRFPDCGVREFGNEDRA